VTLRNLAINGFRLAKPVTVASCFDISATISRCSPTRGWRSAS